MTILVTGATGYIGGSVAARLIAEGRDVRGLVRSEEKARLLAETGVTPVLGTWTMPDFSRARRKPRRAWSMLPIVTIELRWQH
jgi:uncharacterized protein YbjT (DUF2867 family)